jgi:hypothetical protein
MPDNGRSGRFRDLFDRLDRASARLNVASEALIAANTDMIGVIQAAVQAEDDHEDLRDTVTRLEHLILAQSHDLRALRDEVRTLRGGSQ